MSEMSRRSFLKAGTAAAAGMAVASNSVFAKEPAAKKKKVAPSDKLNIIGVGVGGRGSADLRAMESQNIIALADVDWKYADPVFQRYPDAKKYNDFREERMSDNKVVTMVLRKVCNKVKELGTFKFQEKIASLRELVEKE